MVGDMEFKIAGDADSGGWTRGALPKGTTRQCARWAHPADCTLWAGGALPFNAGQGFQPRPHNPGPQVSPARGAMWQESHALRGNCEGL